jgi:hypothetical protein
LSTLLTTSKLESAMPHSLPVSPGHSSGQTGAPRARRHGFAGFS